MRAMNGWSAAEDADLALYDPGICARHVRLSECSNSGGLALDGAACDAQRQP